MQVLGRVSGSLCNVTQTRNCTDDIDFTLPRFDVRGASKRRAGETFPVEINDFNEGKCVRGGASRMKAAGENREQGCCQATKVLNHKTPMSWAASQTSKILDQPVCLCFFHSISDFHDCRTAVRQPVEKGLRSGEIRGLEGLLEQGGAIRADDR